MSKIKDNILKIVNKIFHRKSNNIDALLPFKSEMLMRDVVANGIIRNFE